MVSAKREGAKLGVSCPPGFSTDWTGGEEGRRTETEGAPPSRESDRLTGDGAPTVAVSSSVSPSATMGGPGEGGATGARSLCLLTRFSSRMGDLGGGTRRTVDGLGVEWLGVVFGIIELKGFEVRFAL